MSKSPLANSKTALVFAAMTIISTLMVVGSLDSAGIMDVTAGRLAEKTESVAEEVLPEPETPADAIDEIEPLDPASGWGGTGEAQFGDYVAEDALAPATDAGADPALTGQPTDDGFEGQEPFSDDGFASVAG
ncbi:hypothetical protein J3454_10580 [Erythrobacter sp. NFXS35]|uniref:hypothetical protein n=1 Tax=Erythrobacter sp. NFXS35 TaxID=2818436 RepID=UPI0032DF70DE